MRCAYWFQNCPTPRVKPTKAIGGFSFVPHRYRTVRDSNAPTPAADKKRVNDGGNGFPNPVQIRKAFGGHESTSRGETVTNPFHAWIVFNTGEAILAFVPLGGRGAFGWNLWISIHEGMDVFTNRENLYMTRQNKKCPNKLTMCVNVLSVNKLGKGFGYGKQRTSVLIGIVC